jgi:hypothetical protein
MKKTEKLVDEKLLVTRTQLKAVVVGYEPGPDTKETTRARYRLYRDDKEIVSVLTGFNSSLVRKDFKATLIEPSTLRLTAEFIAGDKKLLGEIILGKEI